MTGAVTAVGLGLFDLLGLATIKTSDYLLYGIFIPVGFLTLIIALLAIASIGYLAARIFRHANNKAKKKDPIQDDFTYGEWDHDWIYTAY